MTNREIELKLTVRPEDLPRLRSAKSLEGGRPGPASQLLETVYFDTGDLLLYGRGASLRVRRKGKRFIQTLKLASSSVGPVANRLEWEVPVSGGTPDPSAFSDPDARSHLEPVIGEVLVPVFTTAFRRSLHLLNPREGVEIEVALDQGEIRTADGSIELIGEVELELKRGDGEIALYDLAMALNEDVPLRVGVQSKAERGYALAAKQAPKSVKAGQVQVHAEDSVETVLARTVRQCVGHLVANEACALVGHDPEGIHQMRVALRRLRSALSVFRAFIPPEQHAFLVGELKWLSAALGGAREWDVFLVDLHPPARAAGPGGGAHRALDEVAAACRTRAYAAAREAILSRRYTHLILWLGSWLERQAWRRQPVSEEAARLFLPVRDLADELLDKRHRQVRRRGRGFAGQSVERRHELRIGLKKLRYAAEFFRGLYPAKPVKRYLALLSAFQEALGHLQDVATVEKLIDAAQAELGSSLPGGWTVAAGTVLGWHARGLHDHEAGLRADWHAFMEAKPFWSPPPTGEPA